MNILKIIYSFCFLFFALNNSVFSQHNKLGFDAIPVRWTDFNQTIFPKNNIIVAKIAVYHNNEVNYTRQQEDVKITLTVKMNIDNLKSSVDKHYINNSTASEKTALLNHEKGHFIISVYYHYYLVQLFESYQFSSNYKTEMRVLIDKVNKERNKMNKTYDLATQHHINQAAQKEWNEKLLQLYNEVVSKDVAWEIVRSVTFKL